MKISMFTPSHNTKHLKEVYETLKEQTHTDWEWVILLNGAAKDEDLSFDDDRVKIYRTETTGMVGPLKLEACKLATGEALLELDHDDFLVPETLFEVNKAFEEHPECCFVYSNTVNWDIRTNTPITWSNFFGWTDRPFVYNGIALKEAVSAEPDPQSISRIWFAPNHLRCWRTKDYWEMGGHNKGMKISDDHDLICRTYLHGKLFHIDKPLYLYRVNGENTWLKYTREIQETMWDNHSKYIVPMMEKWSKERNLKLIDLGGRINSAKGYTTVDLHSADIKCNLNKRWKLKDNSVGVLRAHDVFEHLHDSIHTMNEAYRVLAHGGILDLQVPSTASKSAFRDPTHVSFWNDESIWYYTKKQYAQYIQPQYKGRFQVLKLTEEKCGEIIWVRAHLIAIKKDSPRYYGALEI